MPTETEDAMPTDTDPFYIEQGRLLRSARTRQGLLIKDAAASSGLSQSTLSAYERGERKPPIPQLRKLAVAYQVHIRNLIPGEEPLPSEQHRPSADT